MVHKSFLLHIHFIRNLKKFCRNPPPSCVRTLPLVLVHLPHPNNCTLVDGLLGSLCIIAGTRLGESVERVPENLIKRCCRELFYRSIVLRLLKDSPNDALNSTLCSVCAIFSMIIVRITRVSKF